MDHAANAMDDAELRDEQGHFDSVNIFISNEDLRIRRDIPPANISMTASDDGRRSTNDGFVRVRFQQIEDDRSSIDEMDINTLHPEVQRRNRRIKRMRWWLRLGRETKSLLVLIIFVYTLYLQIASVITDNWDSTRRIGFSEPGACISTTALYDVTPFNVFSWEDQDTDADDYFVSSSYKPFAYIASNSDEHSASGFVKEELLCLSAEKLSLCSTVLQSIEVGESILEFKSYFHRYKNRSYFPFTTLFDVLCIVSLMIAILYEFDRKNRNFLQLHEGQFSYQLSPKTIESINVVVVLTIGILSIIGACGYRSIYDESCRLVYREDSTRDRYCKNMESCGLGLSSIIEPDDALVQYYFFIMLVLGIGAIFTVFLRFILPAHIPYFRVAVEEVDADDENRENADRGVDDSSNDHNLSESVATSFQIINSISVMLSGADTESWTFLSVLELEKIEDECSICLGELHVKSNDDLETFDNNSNGSGEDMYREWSMPSENKAVIKLLRCNHHFHRKCIVQWLQQENQSCPICRKNIL